MTAKAEKPGRQPARGELPVEGPRRRRARGEPRRLLLEAATDLFNERGYSASTRDIADRANVSETLMFRYFGSKAGLFHEAMVRPFSETVTPLGIWKTRAVLLPSTERAPDPGPLMVVSPSSCSSPC